MISCTPFLHIHVHVHVHAHTLCTQIRMHTHTHTHKHQIEALEDKLILLSHQSTSPSLPPLPPPPADNSGSGAESVKERNRVYLMNMNTAHVSIPIVQCIDFVQVNLLHSSNHVEHVCTDTVLINVHLICNFLLAYFVSESIFHVLRVFLTISAENTVIVNNSFVLTVFTSFLLL